MAQIILPKGAAAATPAAGYSVIYPKADGLWYSKDDAGVESVMSGAALAGNASQTFSVAPATAAAHAVQLQQASATFAAIAGSSSQAFSTSSITAESAPSASWAFKGPSTTITIANNATYDLASPASGIILIHSNNTGQLVMVYYASATTGIVFQAPGASHTTTANNAGTINVYDNGTTAMRIQNKTGASIDLYITTIMTRPAR